MFGWEFPPFNSGGLGIACQGIAHALSEAGDEVIFVVPKRLPVSHPGIRFVHADIDQLSLYEVGSGVHPYAQMGSYATDAFGMPLYGSDLIDEVERYALAARRIAAMEPHDVIYAHDWLSFGAGEAAREVSGKPLITHVHATEHERTGGHGANALIERLESRGLHAADAVIAVSKRTRRIIHEKYAVPLERIAVVHNGIDAQTAPQGDVQTSRLHTLKDAGYKLVLFMGRITLQKGPDYFIRAAARVAAHDPKALFVVAGAGDMERRVMELAAQLGIGERVLFPGFLRGSEQREAIALADVFVMPSVEEPFGLVALEAMHAGVPTIVSKQSGVSELVRHALTADFWDTDELANKMLFVLNAKMCRTVLAREGRAESLGLTWQRATAHIRAVMDVLSPPAFSYVYA
jgi:glycosyltransferase involved in cell wall biosynthesis